MRKPYIAAGTRSLIWSQQILLLSCFRIRPTERWSHGSHRQKFGTSQTVVIFAIGLLQFKSAAINHAWQWYFGVYIDKLALLRIGYNVMLKHCERIKQQSI